MCYRSLLLPLALLMAFALPVQAEQYRDFGNYRVHYNAFKSDMLTPEVAKAHGLTRSHYQAIVNITVQKKDGNNGYAPVHAMVEGTARDIYSSVRTLKMMEITEGKAVYYLAEFPITDKQKLAFNIRVIPKGEKLARDLSFEQQFFIK